MKLTLEEQETHLRWSRADSTVTLWTASPVEMRKWKRAGYGVEPEGVGWRASGPVGCVRLRKVKDGALIKRPGRIPSNLPGVPF
jgi:hypothetical protein